MNLDLSNVFPFFSRVEEEAGAHTYSATTKDEERKKVVE